MGTKKYLDAPVANIIYAEEVELPIISICHREWDMRVEPKYGLDYKNFRAGNIFPNESHNVSAEDWFEQALDENYYLLDITGLPVFSKLITLKNLLYSQEK